MVLPGGGASATSGGYEKSRDFYKVLGLRKECSEAEFRYAYEKLAVVPLRIQISAIVSESVVWERKKMIKLYRN